MKRQKTLEEMRAYIAKTTTKTYSDTDDKSFWKASKDKTGNSKNEIRFLPAANGEAFPFIVYYKHAFQGNTPDKKWFIEMCPSSLHTSGYPSDHCPVCALANNLYRSSDPGDKAMAQKMFRGKTWTANILVIKDGVESANNGQVFKYGFGKKIFDKITSCYNPEDGSAPIDPFCTEEGANFFLKVSMVGSTGFNSYDGSTFMKQSAIGTGTEIEAIMARAHKLEPILDPSKFKSVDALQERLNRVMAPGTTDSITLVSKPRGRAAATALIDIEPEPVAKTKTASKLAPGIDASDQEFHDYFDTLSRSSSDN